MYVHVTLTSSSLLQIINKINIIILLRLLLLLNTVVVVVVVIVTTFKDTASDETNKTNINSPSASHCVVVLKKGRIRPDSG